MGAQGPQGPVVSHWKQQSSNNYSQCTDVPLPQNKTGEETLLPIFFLREGGRLYTGYKQSINLSINNLNNVSNDY